MLWFIISRDPLHISCKSSFTAAQQSCKHLLFAVLMSTLISTTTRIDHGLRKPQTLRIATVGDSVMIHYTGYLDNGTIFDSSYQRDEPFTFVVGGGSVIRGFDDSVRGLYPGQSRRIRIEADRAYGKRSDDLVFSVAKHKIPSAIELHVGKRIALSNGMTATITEITDDKVTLNANHHLAGENLTLDVELLAFADKVGDMSKVLGLPKPGLERAVFGLGCFWGVELAYQRVKGVETTKVGYSHGQLENPTYKQVSSGTTGHVEVVAVDYDPTVVSYEELLDLFWERLGRSAMTPNRVGNDVGTQYRSGIYVQDDEQRRLAEASKKKANMRFGRNTVVEIVSGVDVPFYLAEKYHQRYLQKGGQSAEKGSSEPIRCYG